MHYPSHLRERFCQWVDEGFPERAIVEVNYEVMEEPARDFARRFLGCTDLMPRIEREHAEDFLDLVDGDGGAEEWWNGTYGAAAMAWLQREDGSTYNELAYETARKLVPAESKPTIGAGPELPLLVDLHYRVFSDTSKSSLDRLSSFTSLQVNLSAPGTLIALILDAREHGATWDDIASRLQTSATELKARYGLTLLDP